MNWFQKISHVQYTSECIGAHSGQTDCRILATMGGQTVGYLTYAIFEGDYHIQHVEVGEEYRRQGIATDMYRKLEEEALNDGGEVIHSSTTPEGTGWRESLA